MINEQRKSPRKVLKAKAVLAMEGMPPIPARTLDIAANGIAVSTPHQLPVGATGKLSFDLYFEGKMMPISARARALYCIISNGEFKIGFQFISVDLTSMTTLAKFLR
ncbi:MAG: PilZ domain-containing protein [Massilia sp.]